MPEVPRPPTTLILQERCPCSKLAAFRIVLEVKLVFSIGLVHNGDIGADAKVLVAELQDIGKRSAVWILGIGNQSLSTDREVAVVGNSFEQ